MNRQYESVAALAAAAARDPELQEELKNDPVGTLKAVEEPAYRADKWLYRIAIIALCSAFVMALAGGIGLVAYGKEIPDVLIALGSTTVGIVGGLFAPSPVNNR